MAFTVSVRDKTVYGDMRVNILNVTADAASAAIDTGLIYIETVNIMVQTTTGNGAYGVVNVNSGATALGGSLLIRSAANGSQMIVTVYGR